MDQSLSICSHCGEPITDSDHRSPIVTMPLHEECGMRMVLGGLNHIEKRCSCFGGSSPPDPEGLTARQAARAAFEAVIARRQAQ